MTCVECGAEMGTASACATCGAPGPGYLLDKVGHQTSRPDFADTCGGCLVIGALGSVNFVALGSLLGAVLYIIRGPGPGKYGTDYFPLRVSVPWAVISAAVPALTVVGVAIGDRSRSVRKRPALPSDRPEPLPEDAG